MSPTPLIRLGNVFGQRQVYAKCEFLAPSGCFKIRGATHLIDHLTRQGAAPLLVVPSMGNTALGAATAAKARGIGMVGVVPQTISRAKDERLQALGVELVKIDGGGSDLLARATDIARVRGGYFVHPHLDPNWTDGYRAIAEEILAELPGCRSIVLPLGGGGLLSGLASHLQEHGSSVKLYACEPHNYPKYAQFDHSRTRTIADGLILEMPHAAVLERIRELKVPVSLLRDEEIQSAMRELYARHGLIVEPSSAITVALVRGGVPELPEPVCVVLTGGNIAREDFDRLIGSASRGTSTQILPDDYFHTFVYVWFGWLCCGNCELEPDLQWAWEGITVDGEPAVEQFTIRAVEHLKKSGWTIQDDGLRCPRCKPVSN